MTDPPPDPSPLGHAGGDPPPDGHADTDPPLGYAEAMRELEVIVAELEREAVDVDHLSNRVRRAAELVDLLRHRIARARMEVSRVLTDLDPGTGAEPGGAAPTDRR